MDERNKDRATPEDIWISGKIYESYIGRWSRLVTIEFLDWLGQPQGLRWLDLGCGTGALSQAILSRAAPAAITGMDSSKGFIRLAEEEIQDERARFVVGDAQKLPFEAAAFDTVVSGLALNFIPNPGLALDEMRRVTRPGGVVAAYVWDYAGKMEMLKIFWAAVALDPDAANVHEGTRFELTQPEPLATLFKNAGLEEVEVDAIAVPTVFKDFDDFWEPFLGGQGPAPAYVASLADAPKENLRERLRQTLVTGKDGSIQLTARAWAVRGTKPD